MTRGVSNAFVAVGLAVTVWALLHAGWYAHHQIVDYGVYQTYGDKIVDHHAVPYRDFAVEYPPAALPVFTLPSLFPFDYGREFQTLMAACFAAALWAVALVGGRRAAVLAAAAPLALGSVVISRFDLWPAALVALALAALLADRLGLSSVLFGTAFAAKLWPAVLAPLIVVWLVRRGETRRARAWLAGAAATAAVWFLPFVVLSPGGVGHSFHSQIARPLQIESLGAAIVLAYHHVAGSTLHLNGSFGSQNLTGPGTHAAAVATSVAGVLALLALYVLFARRPATTEVLLAYVAAAVTLVIGLGKVFSPQFLIWLIPLVPLVRGRRALPALSLFGVSLVLTQLWFPSHYWDLALYFRSPYIWFVLARDIAVLALAVVLAWPRLEHEVLGENRSRLEALQRVRGQVQ